MIMNSFARRCLLAAVFILASNSSRIATADEPAPPKKTPRAIFAASRESCAALRSGHFIMSDKYTVEEPAVENDPSKAAGEKQAERRQVPRVQLEYWFDADKDLWRIDLTNNARPGSSFERTVATLSPEWMVTGWWDRYPNGDRGLRLRKGSREEHFDRLADFSFMFNVQTLIRLPVTRFLSGGTRGRDFHAPRETFPDEDEAAKEKRYAGWTIAASNDKQFKLVSRPESPKVPGVEYVIECDFLRSPSILPTRSELIEVHATGEKFVRGSTNLEWGERDGVFVPVRYYGTSLEQQEDAYWYEECDFTLNWISVNKPIDPDEFDVVKQEFAKQTIESIHYLDTGTTIHPRATDNLVQIDGSLDSGDDDE